MGLEVRGLTVRFGGTTAVREVDLSVLDGEVLALLGPSGCGKSTLLRTVAGLERPTAGAVRWNGRDLDAVQVHQRRFGLVFQDGQLFPHRDVAGNVGFGPRMRGVGKAARAARVAELLELVGLAGYGERRVTDLSGGEAQRVALARALAADPELLLLDEPLSALDRMLRERLAVDLAALLGRGPSTALVVTHDHDEAFTLADRVAVMARGTVLQADTPELLWRHPADDEVAEFLGCTTFLPATVRDGVATCALGTVEVTAKDGDARLGLRAAGVRAKRVRPDAHRGAEPVGTVRERVHRHDHVRLAVNVPELGQVEAVAHIADAPAVEDEVRLRLDPDGVALVGGD
ncbi:ABC transporter ATP-binding protein [Saccharopolyspora sp. NFXS83]|uniref:ABC transporter ATP-binding protein n=1 Tax=Saccharopolyspora sp. NFXS83 TaxID=2993560 RepID=UPI00224ABDE2|nr:ABC transporter ATP-binding protein [Saccharopolyspora sp. NFXS83]MCX2733275.1 ABC transporter ATP-binding protein [Saccharopolyspora sp. NFXS83]